jgi:DNA repair protein RecN (Recombination protein N)
MIVSLAIRDIVLIDRLQMEFEGGLCVLSGETGAGKSILLSGIGLAIGARSEKELVRHGCDQGSVTAELEIGADHAIWSILDNQEIAYDGRQIILRRVISKDGRSKAFVNDQPVSVALLRQIGESVIEIHGQHDERGLLNPGGHRALLDEFGDYKDLIKIVENEFRKLTTLREALETETERLRAAKKDEEYITHNLEELDKLSPGIGEEQSLANKRTLMMRGEALSDGLGELLETLISDKGVDSALRSTLRKVVRMSDQAPGILDGVAESLDRAATETSEAIIALENVIRELEYNPYDLENTEERLFAIRAAARKHSCQPDDLVALKAEFEQKLQNLKFSDEEVRRLTKEVSEARVSFEKAVTMLSKARTDTAIEIDKLVNNELPGLKMDKAKFKTFIEPLEKEHWNGAGGERADFRVSTNPGAPFGGLIKIASGGELSRFILALKVVLARKTSVSTLIFDEIDQGVGGAVANAVGERLAELADKAQILVITHSPQVAARGSSHWLINKSLSTDNGSLATTVTALCKETRREEIARMLAGAKVTNEARAAADNLLGW